MSERRKRKPATKRDEKPDNSGLIRLLRKRRPTGGIVLLARYAKPKGVVVA